MERVFVGADDWNMDGDWDDEAQGGIRTYVKKVGGEAIEDGVEAPTPGRARQRAGPGAAAVSRCGWRGLLFPCP